MKQSQEGFGPTGNNYNKNSLTEDVITAVVPEVNIIGNTAECEANFGATRLIYIK